MRKMWNKLTLWKLSWFRCLLYALIGGWTEFEHLTETWTQATWSAQGPFDLVRMFGHILFTSIGVTIVAFLDQTISSNKGNPYPIIPSGNTEFIKNTQIQNEKETTITAVTNP